MTKQLLNYTIVFILTIVCGTTAFAQQELKHTRKGNRSYKSNNYSDAEISYRRSIDENPAFSDAIFNLGDAFYKQGKFEDASKNFSTLIDSEIDKSKVAESYYNLGNTLLKSEKLEESIAAYKNSLRNDPENMEAKYNLAYAQDLLKEQQEQEQQQQDDQEKNDDNKEQEEKEENKDEQDNKDDKSEEENQDSKENEDKKDKEEDQQSQQQEQNMSKEDAERLLQALAADEQQVQEKVKKAKAARARVKALKNW